MTPAQALRHSWLRRRLPKPPSENPPPSRRSSAVYRNNTIPKLNGNTSQHNVLNNSSNNSNAVNNNSQNNGRNHANNTTNYGSSNGLIDPEVSKHTKLPKIGGGSNHNLRTGS